VVSDEIRSPGVPHDLALSCGVCVTHRVACLSRRGAVVMDVGTKASRAAHLFRRRILPRGCSLSAWSSCHRAPGIVDAVYNVLDPTT